MRPYATSALGLKLLVYEVLALLALLYLLYLLDSLAFSVRWTSLASF